MANNKKVLIKRSNVVVNGAPKLPTADQLEYGELAMNYADGHETLSFKNSTNEVVKFESSEYLKSYVDGKVSEVSHELSDSYQSVSYPTTEETGGVSFTPAKAGDDLDTAVKNLDTNVSKLVSEVLDNEEVTSSALTTIKESAGFNDNGQYVANGSSNYIASAKTLSEADSKLDAAIKAVADAVSASPEEVYVGETEPTGENKPDIFVDLSVDPVSVEVYTKQEVDGMLNEKVSLNNTEKGTSLLIDENEDTSIEVYTKAQVDAIIAQLKADNNLK